MELILFSVADGDNVINKTLEDGLVIDVNFKRDTDFTSPEIILMAIDGVSYDDFNYCSIPELERFYFIRNVTALNSKVFSLVCECDYLESYKTDILASVASYRVQVASGDYGDIVLDVTGKHITNNYVSTVALEPSTDVILSVLTGGN